MVQTKDIIRKNEEIKYRNIIKNINIINFDTVTVQNTREHNPKMT